MKQLFTLKLKTIAVVIGVCLALPSWTGLALAQGAPNDYQIGAPLHGDFSGTDFENVQLNNGNLHIEIPLWSAAGRGSSVGFKYVYDSLGWGFHETCNRFSGACTANVVPNPAQTGVIANHLVLALVGPQSYQVRSTHVNYTCNGTGIQVINYSYSMAAPDGTHHHFMPDPIEAGTEAAYCEPHPSVLYADDGSGWMVQIDQSTGNVLKTIRKDGTVVGTNIEDTNGNEIVNGTPSTDTLGRQFTSTGYYDSSGTLRTVQVATQTVPVQTNLCWASGADFCYEYSSSTWTVPQVITLPNGMTYTFTYNQTPTGSYYGQPLSVTLPTGGQITWGWTAEQDTGPRLTSRLLSGDPAAWVYGGGIVTDPAGNQMQATCGNYTPPFSPPTATPLCYIITKKYYQGSVASGTLVKTDQTDYWTTGEPAILPIHETTTWSPQNLVSRTETDYDSFTFSSSYTASAANPTEKREFAFGTGTWGAQVRTTDYGYLHLSNSTYLGLNILTRMTSQKLYSGSSQTGTLTAQTLNTYDGVAIAVNTGGNQAPNHDYTNFPSTYNLRGNLTQVSRGLKSGSTWTWLNTNNTYNDLGEIVTSSDPLGYQTSYDYTDSWATIQNPQCVTSTHSYGFPTTVTDPLGHRTKHTYYSCTSLLGSTQDENDLAASRPGATYSYDFMDRVIAETFPDGGQTTLSYSDAVPYSQTATELIRAVPTLLNKVTTTVHDGLGRVQQTQMVDPDCSSGPVKVDYTYSYDAGPPAGIPTGRFTTVSNPYCTTSDLTYGITKTRYDALDRPVLVIPPDGTDAANNQSTSYVANVVTVTDQAGKQRKRQTDALGRLITVWEDPNTLNYETDYVYDVLNNMTSVTQKGGATSTSWRTRTFTYDSLARLTCAANPEITPGLSTVNEASCPASYAGVYTNGTIGYAYDADSNLTNRTAPAPNQTSITSTVGTTFSYDHDNRLTKKSYTGSPTTATVQYGYDGTALTNCATTPLPPNPPEVNPIHNRTSMCDGSGATSWSHDPMGRTLVEQRVITTSNEMTRYTYYADGELNTLTYPSANVVTYTPNSAGRTVSAVGGANNYVTGATYAPQGAIGGLVYGASIHGGFSYNSRLQPLQIAFDGTNPPMVTGNTCPSSPASIMQRLYDFHAGTGDNGDVYVINNCRDTNRTQNFSYDNLNRITQAYTTGNSPLTTSWGETFTIDAWGNLTNKAGVMGKTNTENLNVAPANIKNQLNGFCNDAAGNLVLNSACPTGTFTPTYSYDIENRLTSAAAGYSYVYDGDGQRVKKCSNTGCTSGTLYWTGIGGATLDESNVAGNFIIEEYIFFNARRVARVDMFNCSTNCVHYYFSDHLGSADVITSSTGSIQKEADYFPYGGELVVTGSDINNYKFTGKERDSESGLDNFGARYNSSSLGRFMTPDWAARPTAVPYAVMGDPQSLNLYGYVRNDPVSRADLDGHVSDAITNQGDLSPVMSGGPDNSEPPDPTEGDQKPKAAQNKPETVVFVSASNPISQAKPGTYADRTVDYEAGKVDKNGNIINGSVDRKADITLSEKLDPNSKIDPKSVSIANPPNTSKGTYEDTQTAPAHTEYRVLRQWSVDGQSVRVLDLQSHSAYKYEVNTMNAASQPAIKTEYTNTAPF